MTRFPIIAASAALLLSLQLVRANLPDAAPPAYEIVTTTATTILPNTLRPFFSAKLTALRHHAASSTNDSRSDQANHSVALDIAALDGDAAARRQAASRFPHDQAAAHALAVRVGQRNIGELPWAIEHAIESLRAAFASREPGDIVVQSGRVLHFATDAALPLNATADRNGAIAKCPSWDSTGLLGQHRTVRHRVQVELIERLAVRLSFEVRVSPDRYRVVQDPLDAIFDLLLDTYEAGQNSCDSDAAVLAELGVERAEEFKGRVEQYYAQMSIRLADTLESRLEAAAVLGAGLIGYAWDQAGQPAMLIGEQPTDASGKPASMGPEGEFIGSRSSNKFHRATCSHAKRIKPANIVWFASPQAATKAGRTPCKRCKPTAP